MVSFGTGLRVGGTVLCWFFSFLCGQFQLVLVGGEVKPYVSAMRGASGPELFTTPLLHLHETVREVIHWFGVQDH